MSIQIHNDGSPDLVTQTYERLRELIVHGKLAPGSRIIETDLAQRLGVSRTPVRSALHRLHQEGLVLSADTGKNARLSVAPLTLEDGRELLNILGAMEGLGAGWAAELADEARLRLVERMHGINDRLREILRGGDADPGEVFELHSRFHRLPLEQIDAPRLLAMHGAIRPQVDRYRRIYISSVPSGAFAAEMSEHEPILETLERGDARGARAATQANWARAADRLGQIIAAVGDRGSW